MAVEEELKKDHSDMQAVVDSKQKIIEAQVPQRFYSESSAFIVKGLPQTTSLALSGEEDRKSGCSKRPSDGGADAAEGPLRSDGAAQRPVSQQHLLSADH